MGRALVADVVTLGSLILACPVCHGELNDDGNSANCSACAESFALENGIWNFLPEARQQAFAAFGREYRVVREAEGWGRADHAYYRSLPWVSGDDPLSHTWKRRARSFNWFIDKVLQPLEASRNRPLKLLDLGAGNCWFSHRLAARGHEVVAIDLSNDPIDGLGALTWYERNESSTTVHPVRAEFDRLPLAADQVDLVVFNGSFHYSTSYLTTCDEVFRVLRADGQIVVLDSPCYSADSSGFAMIRDREARFTYGHGFSGNTLPTEGFLSPSRLDRLGTDSAIRWNCYQPGGEWRESLARWQAKLLGRREPATFPLLVGQRSRAAPPRVSYPRVARAASRWFLRLRLHFIERHRIDRPVLEDVNGAAVLVLPGVFNPKLLRTGSMLVQFVETHVLSPGAAVLDLGTGSGIGAVFAGRRARRVVAVDLNPEAVRCARINLALHHLDDHCEVREGDLFGPIGNERFDLILFNPPFYRGAPRDAADRAWRATDVVERFAAQLESHLSPDGVALVILSSDGDAAAFLQSFHANQLSVTVAASRDLVNETLVIYRVKKARR